MIVTINPSLISGNVHAPASKSSMQRACAAALISNRETIISNAGKSNDDLAAIEVIKKLGATVTFKNDKLLVRGSDFKNISREINCGESGLGLRMFAPIAALSHHEILLNGSGSLLQRPMDFFDEIFPQLGISIQSNNGKLPIKIKGPLQPGNITIDGSLSSQFLTGLLMAYAKACTAPVTIQVQNLTSKPYIDLTLNVLEHFGWHIENRNYAEFHFDPNVSKVSPTWGDLEGASYTVEGDWSGASFLLVVSAISGNVNVEGLDMESAQADKAIIQALQLAGAQISFNANKISVNARNLKGFDFDATDCPDLFPPLVALAAYCNGITHIKGVNRLAHKESNRGLSLQEEFTKMNLKVLLNGDIMTIESNGQPIGAVVHSNHDHRIAMACAVAALKADGPTTIHSAEAIDKSYPDFYDHLKMLNASLQIT
ncbi:MAG: 3-phosphoshikimate 1-carboxyvinyltransferase [Ginsengibacter sp.]